MWCRSTETPERHRLVPEYCVSFPRTRGARSQQLDSRFRVMHYRGGRTVCSWPPLGCAAIGTTLTPDLLAQTAVSLALPGQVLATCHAPHDTSPHSADGQCATKQVASISSGHCQAHGSASSPSDRVELPQVVFEWLFKAMPADAVHSTSGATGDAADAWHCLQPEAEPLLMVLATSQTEPTEVAVIVKHHGEGRVDGMCRWCDGRWWLYRTCWGRWWGGTT